MREITTPALALLIVTVIAAASLGAVYEITKEPIAHQREQTRDAALRELIPAAEGFTERSVPRGRAVTAWFIAYRGQERLGHVLSVIAAGYEGPIDMLVAVGQRGDILGIKIVRCSETPGLGAEAGKPEFTNQFIGKRGRLTVTKNGGGGNEIDAVAAATVTSRAVADGVNAAMEFYEANRDS